MKSPQVLSFHLIQKILFLSSFQMQNKYHLVYSEEVLQYCGLSANYGDFDMNSYIKKEFSEHKKRAAYSSGPSS